MLICAVCSTIIQDSGYFDDVMLYILVPVGSVYQIFIDHEKQKKIVLEKTLLIKYEQTVTNFCELKMYRSFKSYGIQLILVPN